MYRTDVVEAFGIPFSVDVWEPDSEDLTEECGDNFLSTFTTGYDAIADFAGCVPKFMIRVIIEKRSQPEVQKTLDLMVDDDSLANIFRVVRARYPDWLYTGECEYLDEEF